jgi:hypothetical protein
MRARLLSLVLLVSSAGCAEVGGELYIEGGNGPRLVFAPTDCADGDPMGFFGVELRDDSGGLLEFFRNEDEPAVTFFDPGGTAFELGPRDCDFFEGSLTRKYNRVTGDGRVHGDLTLDCVTADLRPVHGFLSFGKCDVYADDDDDWDDDDFWDDDDGF